MKTTIKRASMGQLWYFHNTNCFCHLTAFTSGLALSLHYMHQLWDEHISMHRMNTNSGQFCHWLLLHTRSEGSTTLHCTSHAKNLRRWEKFTKKKIIIRLQFCYLAIFVEGIFLQQWCESDFVLFISAFTEITHFLIQIIFTNGAAVWYIIRGYQGGATICPPFLGIRCVIPLILFIAFQQPH